MNGRREHGAALLSVLLLIAVMSTAALAVSETLSRSIARSASADDRARAHWYAVGAEALGRTAAAELMAQAEGRLVAGLPGLDELQVLEVDGGRIEAVLRDATNCFNLNALATVDPDAGADEEVEDGPRVIDAAVEYLALLNAIGVPELDGQAYLDAAADWLDQDESPRLQGAEEGYYASRRPPSRPANAAFADITELRAVRGYERDLVRALDGPACVRPGDAVGALNINTLTVDQAPTLVAGLGGLVTLEAAQQLIAERPAGGWADIEAFLGEPALERLDPGKLPTDRLDVVSSHFVLSGRAMFRDGVVPFRVVYEAPPGAEPIIVQRMYGES